MAAWTAFLGAACGTVLVAAALAKLQRNTLPEYFGQLGAPSSVARSLGRLTPFLEAALGVSLIFGLLQPLIGAAALALSVGFVVIQLFEIQRGRGKGCSCFGVLDGVTTLGVSAVRALLLAAGLVAYVTLLEVGASGPRDGVAAGHALGVTVGLAIVLSFSLFAQASSIWEESAIGRAGRAPVARRLLRRRREATA